MASNDNAQDESVWTLLRPEEDLGRILAQDDPDRMRITGQEYENAMAIKAMVEMSPDLDNLSDLMYVQLAIVCKDNIEEVLDRCYGLQAFREEYKMLDTYEDGRYYLKELIKIFPTMFLNFAFAELDGCYTLVQDIQKFDPTAFTTLRIETNFLIGMAYISPAFHPDIESIRKGHVAIAECQGMTLRRDVMKFHSKFFSEFLSHYPFIGHCRAFHTSSMVNVIVSMLRKILPKDVKDRFMVGFKYDGHLADVLLVPTTEVANQRTLQRMFDALKLRYHNEKRFQLSKIKMPDAANE